MKPILIVPLLLAGGLTGCQSHHGYGHRDNSGVTSGALLGAAAGGIIGHQSGRALEGAAIGAAGGAAIGAARDNDRRRNTYYGY